MASGKKPKKFSDAHKAKKSSNTSTKKRTKPTPRKTAKKRSSIQTKLTVVSFVLVLSGMLGYVFFPPEAQQTAQSVAPKTSASSARLSDSTKLIERLENVLSRSKDSYAVAVADDFVEGYQDFLSEIHDYQESKKIPPPPDEEPMSSSSSEVAAESSSSTANHGYPKLAIIIDDISYSTQLKMLQELDMDITPSLFPPTKRHPDTAELATRLPFYMIHLPLEAYNYARAEEGTLNVGDSSAKIVKTVQRIREAFPRGVYVNNHTGSKYTSDSGSMKKLLKVLKQNDFTFVDSRTSAHSKAVQVGREMGQEILSRDVFLDNMPNIKYIRRQLQKAVDKAKRDGRAIAIGHPHPKTFQALSQSHDILSEVQLVYINKIL